MRCASCAHACLPWEWQHPFDVQRDLGADFFLRVPRHWQRIVWYRDPSTGEAMHSGAKVAGAAKKPGKRCGLS